MFAYLRYFSAGSFVLVVVAAVILGMQFKDIALRDLQGVVTNNNEAIVQGFINTTWKSHPMVKMLHAFQANKIPFNQWERYRGYREYFAQFKTDVFKYFESMPVTHVNIYTANGDLFLAINQEGQQGAGMPPSLAEVSGPKAPIYPDVMAGNIASGMVNNATFSAPDGSTQTGTLVQMMVPVISDDYVAVVEGSDKGKNLEGVVETFYDITPQFNQLDTFKFLGMGSVLVIFILLITVLLVVAGKAEMIIARQHETNLELAGQAAAAEAENREKSQFLANVSHELRTPLNAIIGFSEIIKNEVMGTVDNPQYQEYIRDIHSSGVHLLSLINDILDYSKAEAGKLDLNIAQVDVTKTIKNCMRLVSPRAEQAGVELVDEIPREHYVIETDAKKLKQVLLNLLSNAVKFTPSGGQVKATLWHNVVDESLSIEVKDTGIGIAPKDISRAMAPFGQVDNALSRKYEGTGLGLPLTKKFVEIMGGTFSIQSEVGKGTTITFTLPKDPPRKDAPKKKGGEKTPAAAPAPAAPAETVPQETPAAPPPASSAGGLELNI